MSGRLLAANLTPAQDEEGLSAWTLGSCLLLGWKQESCARGANDV
jgi:hypothetical protein